MRRLFAAIFVAAVGISSASGAEGVKIVENGLHLASPYFDVNVSLLRPRLLSLSVDGLGQSKSGPSALRAPAISESPYQVIRGEGDGTIWIEYRRPGTASENAPGWRFEVGNREIRLISQWSEAEKPTPLVFNFDPERGHVTLLGAMEKDDRVSLPAVLHIPNQGSVRITAEGGKPLQLGYDASRGDPPEERNFIKVTFPAASQSQPRVEYRWEATTICPSLGKTGQDPRFAGFHRNWLNIIQMNPRFRALANNSTSDTCAVCYYEYADIARHTPPLAEGLTALELVRRSLDRVLGGMPTYAMPGYVTVDGGATPFYPQPSLDTYPSLLVAAREYVVGSDNTAWLKENYAGLRDWAEKMLATDRNGNGLIEYHVSGNAGCLRPADGKSSINPANWWDCIAFGHEDAYSNALAYRALRGMEQLSQRLGKNEDAARWRTAADKLRDAYWIAFYNPATGILAGWRSADGQLHDYWFPWLSGAAIHYGLVPKDKANAIMDRLMAKIKEVGYTRFELGLPGNLVPVPLRDHQFGKNWRWGGGQKEDGSEGFQHYENGGATACFVYFTLAALYDLGRQDEADRILFPLMGAFDRNEFEGRATTTRSLDWKSWDGAPFGYEGYLGDNYYTLLAVLVREAAQQGRTMHDF